MDWQKIAIREADKKKKSEEEKQVLQRERKKKACLFLDRLLEFNSKVDEKIRISPSRFSIDGEGTYIQVPLKVPEAFGGRIYITPYGNSKKFVPALNVDKTKVWHSNVREYIYYLRNNDETFDTLLRNIYLGYPLHEDIDYEKKEKGRLDISTGLFRPYSD